MERKTGEDSTSGSGDGVVHDATRINMMARFIQIARLDGESDLHLQDKNIVRKITSVAEHTQNPQLKILHERLQAHLKQKTNVGKHPQENLNEVTTKTDLRSKLLKLTQIFK